MLKVTEVRKCDTSPINTFDQSNFTAGGLFQIGSGRYYPENALRQSVARLPLGCPRLLWQTDSSHALSRRPAMLRRRKRPSMGGRAAGSTVFLQAQSPMDIGLASGWRAFCEGAGWRNSDSAHATVSEHDNHPVVEPINADALAYAGWVGDDLPTEPEWEIATSLKKGDCEFRLGNEHVPANDGQAKLWIEAFPSAHLTGFAPLGTSPDFPYPNVAGDTDKTASVRQWTRPSDQGSNRDTTCCRHTEGVDIQVFENELQLCSSSRCQRNRPSARHPRDVSAAIAQTDYRAAWRDSEAQTC